MCPDKQLLAQMSRIYGSEEKAAAKWGHGDLGKWRKRRGNQPAADLYAEQTNKVRRRVMRLPAGAHIYCPLCWGRMTVAQHRHPYLRCRSPECKGKRPATRIEPTGGSVSYQYGPLFEYEK